jgi:hypothetical protein
MTTDRIFCRFNNGKSLSLGASGENSLGMTEVPEGGLCLSAFLVISDSRNRNSVLMGHVNPSAPWDHIGALDKKRVEVHSKGWMLPSCHLMLHESPGEAAKRILNEQLEPRGAISFVGPAVFSEVYRPKRFPELPEHWDLEFVFNAEMTREQVGEPSAWTDLRFLETAKLRRDEIARSHEDILGQMGFSILPAKAVI